MHESKPHDPNSKTSKVDSDAGLFPKTLWSQIRLVARSGDDESFAALSLLCERYRRPLLLYLHQYGAPAEAEDLLQGFLVRLIDRKFYLALAPEKGKFRSFLLSCLNNFVRDEVSRRNAQRRGAGQQIASLDEVSDSGKLVIQVPGNSPSPDLEFDRAWARTILHRAFSKLESEYRKSGKTNVYRAVRAVLMEEENQEPYTAISARLKMSEGAFRVAVHRIKGRLRELAGQEVLSTVGNEEDQKTEMEYMISLFGMPAISA